MLGKLLGGAGGELLKPLAETAAKITDSKERTKQTVALAGAYGKLASSSWRPSLARAIGGGAVLYIIATTILALVNLYGVVTQAPWVEIFDDGSTPLTELWSNWRALGVEIFKFGAIFLGIYGAGRSAEKVSSGLTGKGIVERVAGAVRRKPVVERQPMAEPPEEIQRIPGIKVPKRGPPPIQPVVTVPEADEPHHKFKWGKRSQGRLDHADVRLQTLFNWTLERSPYDLSIGETRRSASKQLQNIESGASKTKYSRHLEDPSMAVDFYVLSPDTGKAVMGDNEAELEMYREVLRLMRKGSEILKTPITSGGLDWGWDYYHVELDRKKYPQDKEQIAALYRDIGIVV